MSESKRPRTVSLVASEQEAHLLSVAARLEGKSRSAWMMALCLPRAAEIVGATRPDLLTKEAA